MFLLVDQRWRGSHPLLRSLEDPRTLQVLRVGQWPPGSRLRDLSERGLTRLCRSTPIGISKVAARRALRGDSVPTLARGRAAILLLHGGDRDRGGRDLPRSGNRSTRPQQLNESDGSSRGGLEVPRAGNRGRPERRLALALIDLPAWGTRSFTQAIGANRAAVQSGPEAMTAPQADGWVLSPCRRRSRRIPTLASRTEAAVVSARTKRAS